MPRTRPNLAHRKHSPIAKACTSCWRRSYVLENEMRPLPAAYTAGSGTEGADNEDAVYRCTDLGIRGRSMRIMQNTMLTCCFAR